MLVEAFIPWPAVEGLNEGVLHRFPMVAGTTITDARIITVGATTTTIAITAIAEGGDACTAASNGRRRTAAARA